MGQCVLNKARMSVSTDTYTAITRNSAIDLGQINSYRYIDTTGVPNSNSGTYTASSRGASLDMGATNSYRYVNTNGVPNSNSTTFTPTTNNSAHDMGATNNYRYVNTNTVYNLGVSSGASGVISSITSNATYTADRSSDSSAGKGSQTWTRSLAAGVYIATLSGALNKPGTCNMTLSISGGVSNLTKLYDITVAMAEAWRTCSMISYKFNKTSTSNTSFTCHNAASTDQAICLSIIKVS